jgi:hypothetical protein
MIYSLTVRYIVDFLKSDHIYISFYISTDNNYDVIYRLCFLFLYTIYYGYFIYTRKQVLNRNCKELGKLLSSR